MSNEVSTNVNNNALGFMQTAAATFDGVQKLAELMSKCGTMPAHLAGKPSDCFRIVVQAVKWGMDPFAVGECTSLVHGRLCFEGKLVAAALAATGAIEGRLSYEIQGKGQESSITVTGTPRGGKPCSLTGTVKDWRTTTKSKDGGGTIPNGWDKDPHSMLVYRGTRQWSRLYAPEAMLGVRTPEEVQEEDIRDVTADATVLPEAKPARRRVVVKEAKPSLEEAIESGEAKVVDSPTTPVPQIQTDVTPENAPLFPVDQCRKAMNALYLHSEAGKAASKVIMERWSMAKIDELAEANDQQRGLFLGEVNQEMAKLAPAMGRKA